MVLPCVLTYGARCEVRRGAAPYIAAIAPAPRPHQSRLSQPASALCNATLHTVCTNSSQPDTPQLRHNVLSQPSASRTLVLTYRAYRFWPAPFAPPCDRPQPWLARRCAQAVASRSSFESQLMAGALWRARKLLCMDRIWPASVQEPAGQRARGVHGVAGMGTGGKWEG